ncbi:hypothetical protein K431DRAFT_287122 [Polychaeton citri CBS 116435]|uniref:Nucleolar pre-ribosomal-associated protein 1 n=1 Tax=Polychaeton citri CBS 116435 TaxID=1314669 RepID=A0A9P4Q400_9PEZI|nr:hypothetical protein K431DRAFT_287122 [Polychaeton citri CBS 116435]
MSKRSHNTEDSSRPPKRPRNDDTQPPEEILYARQLQDLLVFRQDGLQQLRNAINSFKAFLESILYHREEPNRPRQLSILREYLESQKPADSHDLDKPFLTQLWQAWSFANQNNNDHFVSAVSSIFALLLKVLSGLIDFKEHGYLLCRTVIQYQHLRLIKRGLDAPKHKEFVISPCLRLLIEVVGFDGGQLAGELYKRREQTFDTNSLRRNLGLVRTDEDEDDAKRRVSVRTLTVRYVLAHIRYQELGDKIDILKQRPICSALFQCLRADPSDVVAEVLRTTEQNVLKDNELQRSSKAAVLTTQNLERVLDIATRSSERDEQTAIMAFNWLKAVCTITSFGIQRPSAWYPPGTTNVDLSRTAKSSNDAIDMGLDSLPFYDRESPVLRNTVLLSFVQYLRPQSNLKERELMLLCFKAVPELVAAYFAEKSSQLEPKLTNTWIGYASFLFEIVNLPLPEHAGSVDDEGFAQLPPQSSIVLESILPKPLTQKVLTRCLNQSSNLITFFAVRILVIAFQKLRQVRKEFTIGASESERPDLWNEAIDRLETEFTERCPGIKDTITAFKRLPDDEEHLAQREATTKLLRLYHEVLPLEALEEQFDISGPLTNALVSAQEASGPTGLRLPILENLLAIARQSSSVRWFHTQTSLRFSPVVTLLKLYLKDLTNRTYGDLLNHVLVHNSILCTNNDMQPCIQPLFVLSASLLDDPDDSVFHFIGDCFSRASRGPIKYQDDLDELAKSFGYEPESNDQVSLLLAVVAEQAKFVAARPDKEQKALVRWMAHLFVLHMDQIPESSLNVSQLYYRVAEALPSIKKSKTKVERNTTALQVRIRDLMSIIHQPASQQIARTAANTDAEELEEAKIAFRSIPEEPTSHPELTRWINKDLDLAFDDDDIAPLILCLSSQDGSIRQQAYAQLRNLSKNVEASSMEEKQQLHLLIAELLETYESHTAAFGIAEPLPYLASTFAARALAIQLDPAHFLYAKVNHFLLRRPGWNIRSLPPYWIRETLLSTPSDNTNITSFYWKEVQWVLEWLVDGVRTLADAKILLRSGVLEKLMVLPGCEFEGISEKAVKEKVMEIVWRVAEVGIEGADGLVKSCAGLSWSDIVAGGWKKGRQRVAKAVGQAVISKMGLSNIKAWQGTKLVAV